jgi:hypothetical protein
MTISGISGNQASSVSNFGGAAKRVVPTSNDAFLTAQAWEQLGYLTADDRATLKAATGVDIPTQASGRPPIAPILAFQVAGDRASGTLPAGRDIDSAYINTLKQQYAGSQNPFGNALDKALDFLHRKSGGSSEVDLQA